MIIGLQSYKKYEKNKFMPLKIYGRHKISSISNCSVNTRPSAYR